MILNLKDTTDLDDLNLLKVILSSADNFPGLYRFNSSWKKSMEDSNFLRLLSYFEACHLSSNGKTWSKNEWFEEHQKIYQMGFGQNGRNDARADREIGSYLEKKFIEWFERPCSFSLAVIDCHQEVQEIQLNSSYYIMGSLIKFTEDRVLISHDELNKTSYLALNVTFQEARTYIEEAFSRATLGNLFFKSEIIGQLDFNEKNKGKLHFEPEAINRLLLEYTGTAPIFASVNYSAALPIRFAKLIGVSNVCR